MTDEEAKKKLEELRQRVYDAVGDPNGTCNSGIGACFGCQLADRCKIRPKKMKEDGLIPEVKNKRFFIHDKPGNA